MELPSTHTLSTRYSLLDRLPDWQDQESWRDFFTTYRRLIHSIALRSGLSETEAQEVVQETVICVAKNIHKFKRGPEFGSFRGWLRNLTKWRVADQLRKRTRLPSDAGRPAPSPEQIDQTVEATCDQLWDQEWKESLLKTAMERVKHKVKEEHFQVFDLYALRQWPVSQVAQTLGMSVPAIYLARHRVANMLKKEIKALQKKR